MIIVGLSPIYAPDWERLKSLLVDGHKVTVNGEVFDFSPLEPGHELPLEAIGSSLSADSVLSIALLMPYDEATATDAIRFPESATVTADGPVDIPTDHFAPASETPTIEDAHELLAEQENIH